MSGHRKPSTARHRSDTGSQVWVELLRASGVSYAPLGSAIDGVAWFRDRLALIDFKHTDKSPLTPTQSKLIAAGLPLHFVWNEMSVQAVVSWLKRDTTVRYRSPGQATPRSEWECGQ